MDKRVLCNFATDEEWRKEIAVAAVCEAQSILTTLKNGDEQDHESHFFRGLFLRLDTITSVLLNALDQPDVASGELADLLFGRGGWVRQPREEACHE